MNGRFSMMKAIRRAMNRAEERPDAGSAMVMVLGVLLVGAVVTTTLAFSVMFNTKRTVVNRQEIKAIEAADAAIDMMLAQYEGKKYNELKNVCSQSIYYNNINVNVVTTYKVLRGGTTVTTNCPDVAGDVTTSVVVTATATTAVVPVAGQAVSRKVEVTLAPTPPQVLLDKAIFSEGAFVLTNDTKIYGSGAVDAMGQPLDDANIYANNSISCLTNTLTNGKIYAAQGSLTVANGCKVGNSVWARDFVRLSSQAQVDGDVYAASASTTPGSEAVVLENDTSYISGNVVTNGSVFNKGKAIASGGIGKNVYARLGNVTLDNQGFVGGNTYAGGTITLQNSARIAGNVGALNATSKIVGSGSGNTIGGAYVYAGSTITNVGLAGGVVANPNTVTNAPPVLDAGIPGAVGYPANIQPPAREPLPYVTMDTADIDKWTAAGWNIKSMPATAPCSGSASWNFVNGLTAGNWILDFRGKCPSGVTFNGADFSAKTLTLKANIVIISDTSVSFSNNPRIVSDTPTVAPNRQMYVIMPANLVSWTTLANGQKSPTGCSTASWPPPAGTIAFQSAMYYDGVDMMLYTPCKIDIANDMASGSDRFVGQIYGGNVSVGQRQAIQFKSMPLPSLTSSVPDPTSPALLTMSSRYDVRG